MFRIVVLLLALGSAAWATAASHRHHVGHATKRQAHHHAPHSRVVTAQAASAVQGPDALVLEARDAFARHDRKRLLAARQALATRQHPLLIWAEYWELNNRLTEVSADDIEAFYARWPDSYLEDRLRNDWLLELGHRRDWARVAADYPRFRMNDDREVVCYALLARSQTGEDVRAAARRAWMAQREPDEGCALLAKTFYDARLFSDADVWQKARSALDMDRPRVMQQALALMEDMPSAIRNELMESPQRVLTRLGSASGRPDSELASVAMARWANQDPEQAAKALAGWQSRMAPDTAAWTWAAVARQAALRLMPQADVWFQRSAEVPHARDPEWSDEMLAWRVRAALRSVDAGRWLRIREAIEAMSPQEQRDPAWMYWRGRALRASLRTGPEGDAERYQGRQQLDRIKNHFSFYGQLAAEDLNQPQSLPEAPAALLPEERSAAEQHPGINRALALLALGLRTEGVKEWNFTMRDFDDRQLLAAAQRACALEIWDRCINASDRSRQEIDMSQRFPMPFREDVLRITKDVGVDPAYVYGLIRQESRFVTVARSNVGAAGLMQVMPATAKWTAQKMGLAYHPDNISQRDMNLRLGTGYLKMVLDSFHGSQPLAAAAYNAGPSRSRRWREGQTMEAAAWVETIPFNETRDYVKKVLANTSYYSALLNAQRDVSLKTRLGPLIGPRPSDTPPEGPDLP
ncbi:transglycosylase SLT domain-containing protein [Leptothrix ochracea]|uniref:lytic transglycosylase domain-containing protein n=1 Tax=Leptothrix ochracea TaxID=735331 RepID=UPI0034E21F08